MKSVDVSINLLGEVTVKANGFVGSSCTDATKHIEAAIAAKSEDKRHSDDFYAHNDLYQSY